MHAAVRYTDDGKAQLARSVAALRCPATYPGSVSRVEAIETHMSWVFLTDDHAWKLKKPVRTAMVDLTTAAARRAVCDAEVALNRRLAPTVYLGVVPLTLAHGAWRVGDDGAAPVDWLVQMRRLPADRMLDVCIEQRQVSRADLDRLATTLTHFYERAARAPLAGAPYRVAIAADIASKGESLLRPRYGLDVADVRGAVAGLERWIAMNGDRLGARGAHVVDAHGDLRPEHICLVTPEPAVIDCLEFDRDLRLLDPLSELSYLTLECRRRGDATVGVRVRAACAASLGDAPPDLLAFYEGYHALVRAAIAVWHLDDDAVVDRATWSARGAWYVRSAAAAL